MEYTPPTHSPDDGESAHMPPESGWEMRADDDLLPHEPSLAAGESWSVADGAQAADWQRAGGGPVAGSGPSASVELEPGWAASRALMRISSDELLAVMLRPSFRPVKDLDLVPVSLCPYCRDGGMRTAGSVRTRRGREPVRACDTCATIVIGTSVLPGRA